MLIIGWRVDGKIHRESDVKDWRLFKTQNDNGLGFLAPTIFVFSCGETAETSELIHDDWRREICKKCFPDIEVRHWQITTDLPTWEPFLFSELAQAAEFAAELAKKHPKIGCTFYVNSWELPPK